MDAGAGPGGPGLGGMEPPVPTGRYPVNKLPEFKVSVWLVPQVTAPGMAPPTVGWVSAVAAYGSFIIPAIFRIQVDAGAPQRALHPFTGFNGFCLVLKGWQFARKRLAAGEAGSSPSTV